MPRTQREDDLSTDRPIEAPPPLTLAQAVAAPRARDRLHLAGPTDKNARHWSRAQDALVAGLLTIRSERHGRTQTVTVSGELDLATAAAVADELKAVQATDAQLIILDLSGLTFIDSGGVRLIARADALCRAAAKPLRLLGAPPHIQRVFTLAAADTLPFDA